MENVEIERAPSYVPSLDNLPEILLNQRTERSVNQSPRYLVPSRNINNVEPNDVENSINNISENRTQSKTNLVEVGRFAGSLRHWLIVPVCLLYFGAFITSFFTIQQFVYQKIQRDKYPNITFNSSVPLCLVNESDPEYKIQTTVQQKSAEWMTYFALAVGIPAIFSNLMLGSYTDRFGRKFLFFLPCIGSFIHVAVNALGIYKDFALILFIPSFIVTGLTGNVFGLILVSFSYIADITNPGPGRTFRITIVELTVGLGSTGFSVFAGFFVQIYGFFWPMLVAAFCLALTLVLIVLLPETYTKDKRQHSSSALENLQNAFKFFLGKDNAGKRWMYTILILTFVLTTFTSLGSATVETLYQLNNPFCWDPEHLSWFTALGSIQLVIGMIIVKPLQRILSDEAIAMLGCASFMAQFTLEGLAESGALLYVASALGSLGMFTIPMVRGIFSKLTLSDKQGAVFASIACVETATNVVGTVVANIIYEKTISFFKGFVFFVFVTCNLISFLLMLLYKIGSKRTGDYKTLETQ